MSVRFPIYPSVQSIESSSDPTTAKNLAFTVPPKNSKPSSDPINTCTYSTVVVFPTA